MTEFKEQIISCAMEHGWSEIDARNQFDAVERGNRNSYTEAFRLVMRKYLD